MADYWCKVASDLDSHPKIRKAGRLGREVFLFALRRNALPSNPVPGLLPAAVLEAWFIADQLMMSEEEAVTGVTAAVTCGLLVREGHGWSICGWSEDWGKRAQNGAERTAKWRSKQSVAPQQPDSTTTRDVSVTIGDALPSRVTSSDGCDVREERRLEESRERSTPTPPARKRGGRQKQPIRPLPEDWQPKERHRERAQSLGLDLDREAEKFANDSRAKGRQHADPDSAFTNWLIKGAEYREERKGGQTPAQGQFRVIRDLTPARSP